jgi:hypothetical protein
MAVGKGELLSVGGGGSNILVTTKSSSLQLGISRLCPAWLSSCGSPVPLFLVRGLSGESKSPPVESGRDVPVATSSSSANSGSLSGKLVSIPQYSVSIVRGGTDSLGMSQSGLINTLRRVASVHLCLHSSK